MKATNGDLWEVTSISAGAIACMATVVSSHLSGSTWQHLLTSVSRCDIYCPMTLALRREAIKLTSHMRKTANFIYG